LPSGQYPGQYAPAPYQRTEPAQYAPPTQQPYGVPARSFTNQPATFDGGASRLPVGARHAAIGPEDPRTYGAVSRTAPMRRKGFQWLLVIPLVLPLLVPLYNRMDPQVLGVPFFYWFPFACGVFACAIMTFVYLVTKGRT
jgi:hypothetical protein